MMGETRYIPPPHPASLDIEVLLQSCELGKGRSGGPGGQHRNKVETKVTIEHLPTGVLAQASERRSAVENRAVAIQRLRLALAIQVRCPVGLGDIRSELWRQRCDANGRIACSPTHEDFPAMLAEAMDVIESVGLDVPKAALRLCCTTSQLIKLVKDHPAALESLNRQRAERGMHGLH
jgi:hypothetical protein